MSTTTISISIPSDVYIGLKIMAAKDMRSARNYIAKLIIEHVPTNILPVEPIVVPEIKQQIQQVIENNPTDITCKSCGVQVPVSPRIHEVNERLCKDCRKKQLVES